MLTFVRNYVIQCYKPEGGRGGGEEQSTFVAIKIQKNSIVHCQLKIIQLSLIEGKDWSI